MKRYYLCPVKFYLDDERYAAKMWEYRNDFNFVAEIPSNADGTPREDWALVHVSGNDFSALDNDPEFTFVSSNPLEDGDVAPSGKLKNFLRDKKVKGLDALPDDPVHTVKKRELIRTIGKHLNANFHEDKFFVR